MVCIYELIDWFQLSERIVLWSTFFVQYCACCIIHTGMNGMEWRRG